MTTVLTAGRHLVASTGALLAAAFETEPVSRWLVPDEPRRRRIMTRFFTLLAADAFTTGTVDLVTDAHGAPEAVALWSDRTEPGADEPDPALAESLGVWAGRRRAMAAVMERHHPITPHHYLMLVGVRPDRQRRGLGGEILRARHRDLDRTGTAAYLEATSAAGRTLYARLGYRQLGPPLPLPSGPPVWPMWRVPAGADDVALPAEASPSAPVEPTVAPPTPGLPAVAPEAT